MTEAGRGIRPGGLTVLGSTTCEDTAVVTSRLRALGVPFEDVDIDTHPEAERRVRALNGGHRVTPTVIVGAGRAVAAEPTLERVGELVEVAGYDVTHPRAIDFHGALITRSIPARSVEVVGGGTFSLHQLRGRAQVALFLGHGADCLACFGFARQLAGRRADFADVDARPVFVVTDHIEAAGHLREGIHDGVPVLADPDGAWKAEVAAHLGWAADDALLVLLDRYGAPRAGSAAEEAGGLIDPSEALGWLAWSAMECPECSGELPWPES